MHFFRSARLSLFFLSVLLFLPRGFAQSNLAGEWQGLISIGGTQGRIVWHVKAAPDGSLTSTFDNVDESILGIKARKTEVKGSDVTVEVDDVVDANGQQVNIAGTFVGKLSSDQTELDGNWTQTAPNADGPLELKLKHQAAPAAAAAAGQAMAPATPAAPSQAIKTAEQTAGQAGIAGDWKGVLMGQLHLALHITAGGDGALTATLDSLDQGANGIPVSAISLKDGKLSMTVDAVPGGGKYDGSLSKDGNEIDGNWSQGTQGPFPLKFTRSAEPAPAAAAQTPKS